MVKASSKMKIGHYSLDLWASGGVASYIRRISAAQKEAGHDVVYFDLSSLRGPADAQEGALHYVQDDADLFRQAASLNIDVLHGHVALSGSVTPTVPTIRTVHGHHPYCPSGTRFLSRSGKPCNRDYSLLGCLWGHVGDRCGSIRPQNLARDFRTAWQEMHSLRSIPTIAISRFVKQQMVQSGYDGNRIHLLYHPAPDVAETAPPPTQGVPRFVFLGRITRLKGVEWLLRAVSQVQAPMHLDIAGDGALEPEMRLLARKLGLDHRVTFHGWLSEDRAHTLVSQSRAVVFPSVWHEPAGLVSLDAAANARAVIGSRVGGIPEYAIQDKNALLVDPNDVTGLAKAIERLATDGDLARSLGEEGRNEAVSTFSLPEHMKNLFALYEQCLGGKALAQSAQFAVPIGVRH